MGEITKSKLKKYANGNIFIETGTGMGGAIKEAVDSNLFKEIYSVELHPTLANEAIERFKENKIVKIYKGESPDFLLDLCSSLNEQATFWLDAHASGPELLGSPIYGICPLMAELSAIASSPCKTHTIIIDDIRDCGSVGWPSKQELMNKILSINGKYTFNYIDGYDSESEIDRLPNDILVCSVLV